MHNAHGMTNIHYYCVELFYAIIVAKPRQPMPCFGMPWQALAKPRQPMPCLVLPWQCLGSPCLTLTCLGKLWQRLVAHVLP